VTASLLVALTLNVPFLPQTPALCGGAAVAMVFRYLGDRHADVQQFAPLVDRQAGGIANDVLVEAVRQRNWRAVPLAGSLDLLRDRLSQGEPLILLLEERRNRYHYVVAVGADENGVLVHDPTWGPGRRYSNAELTRRWARANNWALLIHRQDPGSGPGHAQIRDPGIATGTRTASASRPPADVNPCRQRLDAALDDIAAKGLEAADATLTDVARECPGSSAATAELAAVRFARRMWPDAESLAEHAVTIDPANSYAWDVLGSARFVQDDLTGALAAWNRTGKPRLDSVIIDGLSRTRYALVAQVTALTPNTTLTEAAYRLAARRLEALPNQQAVRVGYRPGDDGFATVHVAMVERAPQPAGALMWAAAGARALIARDVRAASPGWSGQGELWSGTWGWWSGRPRVALEFAAPRVGVLPGVSQVTTSWERQTYSPGSGMPLREQRIHGGFTNSDWIGPDLRYEFSSGVDSWNGARRSVSLGGGLERRFVSDRLAIRANGRVFFGLDTNPGFRTATVEAAYRSSREERGLVHVITGGFDTASLHAPLALWPGAGDGIGRPYLLRAHPLIVGDAIRGEAFGRRLLHATAESRLWLQPIAMARVGFAGFIDVADASRRLGAASSTSHADAGAGVRVRWPRFAGVLRADYARGLRDGRQRLSVGIMADPF
jgi:predicted double-glycine peptidase